MTTDWKALESKYYMFLVRRQPVVIERGEGTRVWDVDGKEYLDFTSGWAVNNVGHANEAIAEAIAKQARTLLQTSNQFYSIPQIQLAQILVENSALDKIFICNSGAEANEGAIKLAKKYGKKHKNGAFEIITALNSFHGRTMMAVAATGQPHYQEIFQPIPSRIHPRGLRRRRRHQGRDHRQNGGGHAGARSGRGRSQHTVAQLPETGAGVVRREGPAADLRRGSDGPGRLGTLFGYQSFDVEPDIMTLAKGLGGGVPIGAFLAKDSACAFEPGDHGSTFGGNVLTCAAAYASTKYILDNDVPANARAMGEYLGKGLTTLMSDHEFISEVRGMGLLWAILFNSDMSPAVIAACNRAGLLMNPLRPNAVRLMPPLTVTREEIDEAMERLGDRPCGGGESGVGLQTYVVGASRRHN